MSVEFKLFKSYTNFSAGRSLSHFRVQLSKSRLVPVREDFPHVAQPIISAEKLSSSHLVLYSSKQSEFHAKRQSTGDWTIEQKTRGDSFSLKWIDGCFGGQNYLVHFTLEGKMILVHEQKNLELFNSFRRVYYSTFDVKNLKLTENLAANRNIIATEDGFMYVTKGGAVALIQWSGIHEKLAGLDRSNRVQAGRLSIAEKLILPPDESTQQILLHRNQLLKLTALGTVEMSEQATSSFRSIEAIRFAVEQRDKDFTFTCLGVFKWKLYAAAFHASKRVVRVFTTTWSGNARRPVDIPAAFHVHQLTVHRGLSCHIICAMHNDRSVSLLCDKHGKLLLACCHKLEGSGMVSRPG